MKKLLFTIFVCSTLSAGMFDNVINPNGKPGLLTVSLSANPGAKLPITNWMTVNYNNIPTYSYELTDSELIETVGSNYLYWVETTYSGNQLAWLTSNNNYTTIYKSVKETKGSINHYSIEIHIPLWGNK